MRAMLEDVRTTLSSFSSESLSAINLDVRKLWGEATSTAVYLKNRLPHAALPTNITPYEALFKHKPSISHLQPFGKLIFPKKDNLVSYLQGLKDLSLLATMILPQFSKSYI